MFKILIIYISLLTCTPGSELYSRYGHTAIRVQDTFTGMDMVYNYGCFSFDTDHFYWKFVKGQTYYTLEKEPYMQFKALYNYEHRKVYEQRLNLSSSQALAIAQALETNYQPQNKAYLYNFVFDNCATRPYYLLQHALGDSITSMYQGWTGCTYRDFIHQYTGKGSWADFGINMIFGKRANEPMSNQDRLFLPEELMRFMHDAQLPNGQKLIQYEHIGTFASQQTPWYQTWYFGVALFILIIGSVSYIDRQKKRWSWWIDLPFILVYIILLIIVVFLTYFSIHPLVGWNWRLLLFPLLHVCLRLIYIVRS